MTGEEFVGRLLSEIDQVFERLGERQTLEAGSEGRVAVVPLLKLALTSELEASELGGLWVTSTRDIAAKRIFAEQCGDEMKHYEVISRRLAELGEDLAGFDPVAGGYSPLYQYHRSLRTTVERMAGGPFTSEAIARVRNAQFIEFCDSSGDQATASLYRDVIQPEEIHHHEMGRDYLVDHCTTPERQDAVWETVRNTLAIADELRTLKEKMTGMHSIPVS